MLRILIKKNMPIREKKRKEVAKRSKRSDDSLKDVWYKNSPLNQYVLTTKGT